MSVSDGATVRRDRMFDMLQYIRGFMPQGCSIPQVQLYMSIAHGLTYKTSQKYIVEMQTGRLLTLSAGFIKLRLDEFNNIIETLCPERDPNTGDINNVVYGDTDLLLRNRKNDDYPGVSPEVQEINRRIDAKKRAKAEERDEQSETVLALLEDLEPKRFMEIHNNLVEMEYYETKDKHRTLRILESLVKEGLINKLSRGEYQLIAEAE